jgi:homoserine kinase
MQKVVVRSPASTANLGPGFDCFALALENPYDKITLEWQKDGEHLSVQVSGVGAQSIPKEVEKNCGGVVAKAFIQRFDLKGGFKILIEKGVPPALGLGSSAATCAGVAFAFNELFGLNLSNEELVELAALGEVASAGTPHADNVSASLLGGFTLVVREEKIKVLRINPPPTLLLCVIVPKIPTPERKTEVARRVLPSSVSLKDMVWQVSHASLVAAGFALGEIQHIASGMKDIVVEKARSALIPGFDLAKEEALKSGALAFTISGAGPSVIALSTKDNAQRVLDSSINGFLKAGVQATGFVTKAGKGCTLLDSKITREE